LALVVTETDSVYSSGSFPPLAPGDLLTNTATSVVANTLTVANENHLPSSALYDGRIGAPLTTNRSYEISGGAITFSLGAGPNGTGYSITNLSAWTAWQDNGRENANYAVSFSTDGTNFFPIGTVAYNPSPYPAQDGTGGTFTSLAVQNLTGVRYLRWNFSAAQQNGGVGYTEVAAFGRPSASSTPVTATAALSGAANFVINLSGLSIGWSYQLQSSTNLAAGDWQTESNFVASQSAATFITPIGNAPQKFYRLVGN
jgi:hypothetical protein